MKFKAICILCDHAAELDNERLSAVLEAAPSKKNIHRVYKKLICKKCSVKQMQLLSDDNILLIDPGQIRKCLSCDEPIILPRQQASPTTTLCIECAEANEAPQKFAPYPQPPNELSQCPKCKWPTIIREHSQTGEYFIGCTHFPKCFWSSSMQE